MPLWFVLALLWTLAILVGCSMPAGSMPESTIWSFDKLVHLVIFGGFGVLWMQVLKQRLRRPARWVLVAGLIVAVATELGQGLVPGRSPELLDAVADVAGVALGVGLCLLWQRRSPVLT